MSRRKKEPSQDWLAEVAKGAGQFENPFGMFFHSAIAARGACENHSRYQQTGGDVGAVRSLSWMLVGENHWKADAGEFKYSVRRVK